MPVKVPQDIEENGLTVISTTETNYWRQHVQLPAQDQLISVLVRMEEVQRSGKFTGRTIIHWNQGGVKGIETEQETELH